MNIIRNLPGPLLVFLGACCLSFGGLIVKSFEGATLWQILFWRTIFFILVISIYLIITYKRAVFRSFYNSGIPGLIGGFVLSFGFCGYVFAMYNTTVANANFIIQTQTIFLAIFGYFFLKEKISVITLTSIILAMVGIIMLTEAVLGPMWAWIFINEQPPFIVLIGGSIVLFAVLLQFYNLNQSQKISK